MDKRTFKHYIIIAIVCVLLTVGLCFALYHAQTYDGFVMCFLGASYIFAVCLILFLYTFFFSRIDVCLFKSKKSGGAALLKYFITMLILVVALSFAMGTSWAFRWYNSTIEEYKTLGRFLSTAFMYMFVYLSLSIPTIALGTVAFMSLYRNNKAINKKQQQN